MKQLNVFLTSLVLTCLAMVPAIATADDLDDLDVTMTVVDDLDGIDDVVTEMRGPEDGNDGDSDDDVNDDAEDDFSDESDRDDDREDGGDESGEDESGEDESGEDESDEDDSRFEDQEDSFVTDDDFSEEDDDFAEEGDFEEGDSIDDDEYDIVFPFGPPSTPRRVLGRARVDVTSHWGGRSSGALRDRGRSDRPRSLDVLRPGRGPGALAHGLEQRARNPLDRLAK